MKKHILKKYKSVADEWMHNGNNAKEAYLKIYPDAADSTARVNSCNILKLPLIEEYISKKMDKEREKAEKAHGVTKEKLIKDQLDKKSIMSDLFELASKEKLSEAENEKFKRLSSLIKTSDVNKADELLIKMLGLFQAEKVDVTSDGEKVKNVFIVGGKEVEF